MSAVGLSLSHNLGAFPVLVVLTTSAATAFAQVPKEPQKPASLAAKPPWQRVLTVDAAIKVEDLEKKIAEFERKGEFAASLAPARQVVEIRRGGQGQDHWQTVEAMVKAEAWALVASADERRQSRLAAAIQRISAVHELTEKQRYAEAEPLFSKVEDTDLSLLGKGNWISITIDLDMGVIRRAQGRYEEAESLLRKALAICRRFYGEDHPDTGAGYHELAYTLFFEGKYSEAVPLARSALSIAQRVMGENDIRTANCYTSLAINLNNQGRYAEAEPTLRTAVSIARRVLGEDCLDTARSYLNLASNLYFQGKYGESWRS